MSKLAINKGPKIRTKNFPAYKTIGEEEKIAVNEVLDSGILSRFLGTWHNDFYGGPQVQAAEKEWANYFNIKHAIAVNSATSALFCAIGALGIGLGDEVIVSPYTMSASAVAPLIYNAVPVFADIEEDYFCLDPGSIEQCITKFTKAIIVVDIFGQPYNADAINYIAKKHKLYIIEDCAQAPAAKYKSKWAGTLGDIGVFSLNYHKHIHSGEGSFLVTNNDILAEKLRLIRNHAEAVIHAKNELSSDNELFNMLGFNYRMTEIEAAISKVQLGKLSYLVEERRKNIDFLNKELMEIPCLEMIKVRPDCKHSYYVHPIKYAFEKTGVHRDKFLAAVKAELPPTNLREGEGVNIAGGYVKPLYLQPLYQKKIAYNKVGFPWSYDKYSSKVSYNKGICPITEKMHYDILITHELMRPGMSESDLNDVIDAFHKVYENINELKE